MTGRPPRQSVADRILQLDLAAVSSPLGQTKARSRTVSDEGQAGNISPFAGGKAFPSSMDADTMTLAAGKVMPNQQIPHF
ncbi:hypothetical protein ABBQ32_001627 [Trebouxia sp. C0010 RCD-2024]